jgi:hypothetical protein
VQACCLLADACETCGWLLLYCRWPGAGPTADLLCRCGNYHSSGWADGWPGLLLLLLLSAQQQRGMCWGMGLCREGSCRAYRVGELHLPGIRAHKVKHCNQGVCSSTAKPIHQ